MQSILLELKTLPFQPIAIPKFFINYGQHKVGISDNHFIPFVSFVTIIVVTHKFGAKYYLIFLLIIKY